MHLTLAQQKILYLKYKTKYINLKKQQVGGVKPYVNLLIEFNNSIKDFDSKHNLKSPVENYEFHPLHPVHGFLWVESWAIRNIYKYEDDEEPIKTLVKILFKPVAGVIELSTINTLAIKLTPKVIGTLVGYLHLVKLTNITKWLQNSFTTKKSRSKKSFNNVMNKHEPEYKSYLISVLLAVLWWKLGESEDGVNQYLQGLKDSGLEEKVFLNSVSSRK